jgi:ribosomal protein S18 acetylase RimI-like enzyme
MTQVHIKIVTIDDLTALQAIGRQTFIETFSESNSADNMAKYIETGFTIEKLSEELVQENAAFYFALEGEAIIGYLKLNWGSSQTELKDQKSLEIERIYVLKAYQGKKIGQLLYEQAIQIAKEKNANYIWLGVWEENHRAIQFYKKNGFVAFDKHIFQLGDDAQTDIMMKLILP